MRRIGFSIAATILTWLLCFVCVYVLFTAPQLRYFIETGYTLDWISRDYRDLGLFLGVVAVILLCIASLSTYFLISNVRVRVSANPIQDEILDEKPKNKPEDRVNAVLSTFNEDELAELRQLMAQEEDQMLTARRH